MLVSRRRGRGGGRGGVGQLKGPGSRAVPISSCDHFVPPTNVSKNRNNAACSTCGRSSARGQGSFVKTGAPVPRDAIIEVSNISGKIPTPEVQGVDSLPDIRLEVGVEPPCPLGSTSLPVTEVKSTPTQKEHPEKLNPNEVVLHPSAMELVKGKKSVPGELLRSLDYFPNLRTSKNIPEASKSGCSSKTHRMIVDTVTSALMSPSIAPTKSDQETSETEKEKEASLENDEDMEPEDQMTLDQYQNSF